MILRFSTRQIKNALLGIALLIICLFISNNSVSATKPNTSFYGSIQMRLAAIKDKDTSLNNAGHKIGLKGEGVLNNGWDFFYKLEAGLSNDDGLGKKDGTGSNTLTEPSAGSGSDLADMAIRQAHVGISNSIGSLTFGRQDNPFANTYTADVFTANSGSFEQAPFRLGHAMIFKTANDKKARAYLGTFLEGGGDEDANEQVDGYVIGGRYTLAQFVFHLGLFHSDFVSLAGDQSEFSDISLGLSYQFKRFYLAVNAEQSVLTAADGSDITSDKIDLGVTYTIDTITYGTGFATQDDGNDKKERFLIGAYLDLGSNNDCYIELGLLNKAAGDNDNIAIGYGVSF